MDHFPYKPKMFIELYKVHPNHLQKIYNTFTEEVQKIQSNNGSIIIPQVIIITEFNEYNFRNVNVSAHNLRNDTLQNDVITAIDVIMSLGDQGKISYALTWYGTVGAAEVNSYFIEQINTSQAHGRCGFVYEVGDWDFSGFTGNHIHIPSDIRIITSPQYAKWFWICI